jgi:restriction system protein
MTNYATTQIQSFALIIIFFFYFLIQFVLLWKSIKNRSLLKRNRTLKKLKRLSWDDFELLTMELFMKIGWKVSGNEKKGADGGVDIWMQKGHFIQKGTSAIVQCKRYEDTKVTIKVVREMYGLMHEHSVDEVYIVTTSGFTRECYTFVAGKQITLINGESLVELIERYV